MTCDRCYAILFGNYSLVNDLEKIQKSSFRHHGVPLLHHSNILNLDFLYVTIYKAGKCTKPSVLKSVPILKVV